jgi:hypothetical protein
VLTDTARAQQLVATIREAGAPHTWDRHAKLVRAAYEAAIRQPAPPAARLGARLAQVEHAYWRQRDTIGPAGYSLVDPDDPLLSPDERELLVEAGRGKRTRPALLRAARALTRLRGR